MVKKKGSMKGMSVSSGDKRSVKAGAGMTDLNHIMTIITKHNKTKINNKITKNIKTIMMMKVKNKLNNSKFKRTKMMNQVKVINQKN